MRRRLVLLIAASAQVAAWGEGPAPIQPPSPDGVLAFEGAPRKYVYQGADTVVDGEWGDEWGSVITISSSVYVSAGSAPSAIVISQYSVTDHYVVGQNAGPGTYYPGHWARGDRARRRLSARRRGGDLHRTADF